MLCAGLLCRVIQTANNAGLTFFQDYLPFGKLMARPATKSGSDTRQQILQAALRRFAHSGYAGAAVQHIVDEA